MNTLMKHLLYLSALLVLADTAQAASITVDGTACTLAEAITSANNNNAAGNGCVDGSGADTIILQTDVTLTADLPQITTVITIEGGGHFISGNNTRRVLYVAISGNLTLNKATVKEGKVSVYPSNGGGINNMGGVISLTDCTVSGNNTFADPSYPVSYGGGIYNSGGTVTLTKSTVSSNTADSYGGGIFNVNSGTVTLTNSTITGNSADDPNSGGGGGIANVSGSTVTLTNSTVSGNVASHYHGGGIYNASGTATLTSSTVSGNSAAGGGGISNDYSGTVTLTNSTISGNTTSFYGGGIYNYSGTVTLTNSTVSGNTSSSTVIGGGGIYNKSTVKLYSSLISGNEAAGIGNEVYNYGAFNAASYNLFGHSGETSAQAFSSFTPSGSDVVATSNGSTPTALSAILNTTLADNGGFTQTHALVAGSTAIDLDGTCNGGKITTDQRGYSRPVGSDCDAGAFEYGAAVVTSFKVTASADTGGSISPAGEQTVNDGETISFTVTPDANYTAASAVGGTCPQGSWNGSTYTTGAIKADCSVVFSFTAKGSASKTNMAPIYQLLLGRR